MKTAKDQLTKIRVVATDRNPGVTKLLKNDYADVSHDFDPWHVQKSITKQILYASRKKGKEILFGVEVSSTICGGLRKPVVVMII